MIQKVLHFVGGIEQYGVASLCLFGFIFICVFTWAFLQKRSHLDYMARVALEPGDDEPGERSASSASFKHRPSNFNRISP